MNIRKKIVTVFTLCLLIFTLGFTFKKNPEQYSLKESYSIALQEARKISPDVKLNFMTSVDDINAKYTDMGTDGKRHKWNFDFNVPNTTKHIHMTLENGKFKDLLEANGLNIPENLIELDEIVYDSPELVEKAKKDFNLTAGKNWAKGFHFVLGKENGLPYVTVVGDNDKGELTYIDYNSTNGELIK